MWILELSNSQQDAHRYKELSMAFNAVFRSKLRALIVLICD